MNASHHSGFWGILRYPKYPQKHLPRVFDTSFDYKTDTPRTRPDPDSGSQLLRWDHELLWSKELRPGVLFGPKVTTRQREYLIFSDANTDRYCYGSDAITSSYTRWVKKKKRPRSRALADAIAGLDDKQRARYLNPPYTMGSAMIWPVRTTDYWTMNRARGARLVIADRMDLTLECIRRNYTGEPGSPLAEVTTAYKDFFELFGQREQGFKGFVDFFHFQDLTAPGSAYQEI